MSITDNVLLNIIANASGTGSVVALTGALSALAAGALALGKTAVTAAAEYEQSEATFTRMLGSAQKAKQFLGELATFAANTPFELKGLRTQAAALMNMGFSAQQVIPTLTAVGDAAGGQQDKIESLVRALGQMRAKTKVSAEEMNQLAEAGLPAWDILANKLGISIPEAMDRAQKGMLSAAEGIPALLAGMEERFGGSMAIQMKTLMGQWSNFQDNLNTTLISIGFTIIKAFGLDDLLAEVNTKLGEVKTYFENFDLATWAQENRTAILVIAGALTVALLPALLSAGLALYGLLAPLAPLLAIGAALGLLLARLGVDFSDVGGGIQDLSHRFVMLKKDALDAFSQLQSQAAPILANLKAAVTDALAVARDVWERVALPAWRAIQPIIQNVLNGVMPLLTNFSEFIRGAWAGIRILTESVLIPAFEAIWPIVQQVLEIVGNLLRGAMDLFGVLLRAGGKLLSGDWKGAWEEIKTTFIETWDRIAAVLETQLLALAEKLVAFARTAWDKAKTVGANLKDGMLEGLSGLSVELATRIDEAINNMTAQVPDWAKNLLGITKGAELRQGLITQLGQSGDAAAESRRLRGLPQIGPELGGSANLNIAEESGKFGYAYISKLKDVFKNDPTVDSDCAVIASAILNNVGARIKGSANAGVLEKNAQAAGFQQVEGDEIRPGDLVIWTSGNGKTYGKVSGKHAGVAAGYIDGQLQVINNPGSSNTQVEAMYDRRNATAYRSPDSPFASLKSGGRSVVTLPGAALSPGTPGNISAAPTDFTGYGGTAPGPDKDAGPITEAQIIKAQQLEAAIKKAAAAVQASPTNNALKIALDAAQEAAKKWSGEVDGNARALAVVRAEVQKTGGAYLATAADVKKFGQTALGLLADQERAAKSNDAVQIAAAEGAITRFREAGKAQAAVLQIEQAVYNSRRQLSEKAVQDEQAGADLSSQIAKDAAAGREAEARSGLEQLKRAQAERLDLAEGNAAKIAQITVSTGPQILAAEATIARRVREQAVRAANDTAADRLKVEGANKGEIEKARRSAVAEAYRIEKEAGTTARAEQTRAERGANRTAAEEQKTLASELAGLKIDSAKATSGRLKALADEDFRRAEGDAGRQLALVKKSSQEEFDRAQAIAIATRKLAYQDASGKPNEAALREKAQAEYLATLETARITRLGQVRTAQDAVTKSLDDGTRAGNAALDGLEKLNEGGRDLAASAQKIPDTRAQFDTLFARIVALRDELADSATVDAWTQSIQDMGKAGQLSGVQVQTLLSIIKDLNVTRDVQKGDNLQGRGVVREAAVDDASRGTLGTGEAERLVAAMIGMDPEELGGILAGLVAKGFGESDLAALIRAQLAGSDFSDLALMVNDGNGKRFQTDDEVRGIGQPAKEATAAYLNLEEAIQNVGNLSQDELSLLIKLTKTAADDALKLWEAWSQKNPVDISAQLDGIMPAQVLMDQLESATDPVQIQAITGDIATFLTSDVGKLLPDGVRQGLEDGVKDAEGFAGILTGLTAGAVADGLQDAVTRTNGAKLPQNRFSEFANQIMDGAFDLSNPEVLKGLNEGLDISVKNSELTAAQLRTIQTIIAEINAAPLELAPSATEAQFVRVGEQVDGMVKSFELGEISLGDFAKQALEMGPVLERMAQAAEKSGGDDSAKIAAQYRDWAKGLDELVPAEERSAFFAGLLAQATDTVNTAMGESKAPHADMIKGLEQLKASYPGLTSQIDQLIKKLGELDKKTAQQQGVDESLKKLNKYADYAKQAIPGVAAAFQVLGGVSGEVADAWGESLGNMTNDVVNFAASLIKGDYVGAIIGFFTSIFTGMARQAKAAQAELKKTSDYNNQFRFDQGGYGTRQVTETQTGFLWWKKTVYTEKVDEVGKAVALGIEGGVVNGFNDGFTKAFESNDVSLVEKAVTDSMKKAALNGLVEGFLNSGPVIAAMGPLVKALQEAFLSGDAAQIDAALNKFKQGMEGLKPQIEATVSAGRAIVEALVEPLAETLSRAISSGIESGVVSGAKSGIQKAIATGDTSKLGEDIRFKAGDGLEQALIDVFLNSAAIVAIIKPAMDALAAALSDDDPTNDDAAFDNFDRSLDRYAQASEKFSARTREQLVRRGLIKDEAPSLTNIPDLNTGANRVGSVSYQAQSSGVIGNDQTFKDFGSNVAALSSALRGVTDLYAVIRETATRNYDAALKQVQAAEMNIQAAGQRFADSVRERPRMNFGGK